MGVRSDYSLEEQTAQYHGAVTPDPRPSGKFHGHDGDVLTELSYSISMSGPRQ